MTLATAPLRRWLGLNRQSTRRAVPLLARASWRVAPGLSVAAVTLTVVAAVAAPLQYVAIGRVVAGFTAAHVSPWPGVALLIVVASLRTVLPSVTAPLTSEVGRRVDRYFRTRLVGCLSRPQGIAHLEDPRLRDLISAAGGIASPGDGPGAVVSGYLSLLGLKVAAVGSAILLAEYRWWLGLGVIAGAALIRRQILRLWFRTAQALRGDVHGLRRSEYLRDVALRPEAAKECRLFGLGGLLIGWHDAAWVAAMGDVWRTRRRIGWQMVIVDLMVLLLAALAAVPILLGLLSGELSAGRAAVLAGALTAIIGLGGFLPDADFPIRYGCLTLPSLLELESVLSGPEASPVPSRETSPVPSSPVPSAPAASAAREGAGNTQRRPGAGAAPAGGIRFDGVSFRYPGTARPVLERIDFTIAGGPVALVGPNGAGKTTLIKLLTKLYKPTCGSIWADGADLAAWDTEQWRRRIAVIFQDFARYQGSARDNVGFGSLALRDDIAALEEVAARAGVLEAIQRMPLGWETPLSRSYRDGADVSGGQWQRIALARALLAVKGGARLLILDEPTANLDVRAEAEFYDHFLDLAAGLTTILVSHRFGTVRRADRILVLDGGRIVEDGSHDELVSLGGRYARMFARQAERFASG